MTAAGTLTVHANVGTSPYGHRRDVKVTVVTGDVTMTATPWFMTTHRLGSGSAGFKSWVNDGTIRAGQTLRVASLARDTKGHGIAGLKVTWTLTFANGTVLKSIGYTDVNGKTVMTLPITSATPRGITKVSAKIKAFGVARYSTTSFKRS